MDRSALLPRAAALGFALLLGCGGAAKPAARAGTGDGSCADAAAAIDARTHGGSLIALTDALAPLAPFYATLEGEIVNACSEGSWSADVRACMVAATSDAELRTCEDKLSLAQRRTLAARVARVIDQRTATDLRDEMCACTNADCATAVSAKVERFGKASEARYPKPTDAPAGLNQAMGVLAACEQRFGGGDEVWGAVEGDSLTGVAECDRFLDLQDRYFACDKVPQQAKDAMKQAMDQQKQAWAMLRDPNVPEEAKRAAADGCKQGGDALRQSAAAMGCSL
ncbi:MAG: DUF5339 domain-containing protein [Deltaproteobacteria bacterium]|nr:DUF5339 domain-containing protein [Deltaproteobacteria bacterium]